MGEEEKILEIPLEDEEEETGRSVYFRYLKTHKNKKIVVKKSDRKRAECV